MERIIQFILQYMFLVPALLVVVTVHEVAHAWVADRLGDPTPRRDRRLSLNPIRHLDPMGTLMLVIFKFGWGKPVRVNYAHFEDPRRAMFLISLAGPASNFVLAAGLGLVIGMLEPGLLRSVLGLTALISIFLGVFNLVPIPPLDGSRVVSAILPRPLAARYNSIEPYGIAILFVGIFVFRSQFFGILTPIVNFFSGSLLPVPAGV